MIAVFDIDGVLADAGHREHYVAAKPKDWDSFFSEVGGDAVIAAGRERLGAEADANHEVILLSGRPERTRADTEAWLDRHGFAYSRLLLRSDADRRKAARFKVDIVQLLGAPSEISVVVDDDETVTAALSALGYTTETFA
jgi:phosphoglycolate phosphatase-like HAD superfamily hydrolase